MELGPLGSLHLEQLGVQLGKMLIAFALCFPMAWDRERSGRSLGIRTFPLIAVASCAFVLVGHSGLHDDAQAMSRVLQGIIAGVGFLGGGAIVKQGMTVAGTTTAAAVWTTSALGVAVGAGEYGIALALSVVGFATLRWLLPLKRIAAGGKGDRTHSVSLQADEEEPPSDGRSEPASPTRARPRRRRIVPARR